MSQRFFGQPESQLFGVYHKPRGKKRQATRAALICPPIGQEYIRTHWSLRLMANQLARNGVHVLRFDYSGIGDSAGSIEEITSVSRWQDDIEAAIDHLKSQSGATSVMLIGQRFGSWLATEVARFRDDVNSVVCWEPVVEGQQYLDRLREMHRLMIDLWVCKMATPDNDQVEEILGSQYQRSLLNEIEAAILDFDSVEQPHFIVDVDANGQTYSHSEPGIQKVVRDDRPSTWYDLKELETVFLRPLMTREIVTTADEIFNRLVKFKALERQMAGV